MKTSNYKSIVREHGLVLLFFMVLALIFTYPVITQITNHAAGIGRDGFAFMGFIWHVSQVLMQGGGISEIYYSDLLLYPHGASLEWENLTLTNTLFLAFPLTLITDNLVLIYNLLFLFNFVMAGYAMYLLIKYLVKDRAIAFLVGFVYTFSPLHMAWGLELLHMMSFCWTPFFFLFFFKMFEEEKMRNAIVAAIFLFFLALASWYHLLFAFLIAAPYFIYKLIIARPLFTKHFLIRTAVFLILFCIIILPFMIPMMDAYFSLSYFKAGTALVDSGLSPFHYLLPSILHPLWGEKILNLSQGKLFAGRELVEMVVSPGYLVIFICLLCLIKTRKYIFWFLLASFFFLLSVNFQGITLSTLSHFLLIRMMSHIARLSFIVLFSLLIIFAFSLSYFLYDWKQKLGKSLMTGILFIILAVDYITVPYPTTYEDNYRKIVIESAREIGEVARGPHPLLGDDFIVLDFSPSLFLHQYNFYFQVFHKKPIIGGNIARPRTSEMQTNIKYEKVVRTRDINEFRRFLEKNKVGYIIFYKWREEDDILFFLQQTPNRLVFHITAPYYTSKYYPHYHLQEIFVYQLLEN